MMHGTYDNKIVAYFQVRHPRWVQYSIECIYFLMYIGPCIIVIVEE